MEAKKKTKASKPKNTKSPLSANQKKFCEELVKLGNQGQAYKNAYSTCKSDGSAYAASCRLLRDVRIKEYIKVVKKRYREKRILDEDRVLKEEACLALLDIGKLFTDDGTMVAPNELPEDVRRAVSSVQITETVVDGEVTGRKFRYKFWDKGKSLERVSRMLGLYKDRLGIDGDLTIRDALDEISRQKDGLPDIS